MFHMWVCLEIRQVVQAYAQCLCGLQGNFISLEKRQLKDTGCNHLQNIVSIIQKTAAGICEVLKVLPCRLVPSQCCQSKLRASWKTVWQSLIILEHSIARASGNHTRRYLPKATENLYPQKNLHTGYHSSFIQHCQKLEATKYASGEQVNKPWPIQTMECYSVLKRNGLSRCEKTQRKLKNAYS